MRRYSTREVTLCGILFALAIALSIAESAITPLLGLMPGVKIGLSNIVVMYALFFMGKKPALTLALLKSFFVFLTRGATAGFLSLCGGMLSLAVMAFLFALPLGLTWFVLSVCGSLAHNIGQLIGASLILGSAWALAYLPVLLLSGLGMGLITSASLSALIPALSRLGFPMKK